MKTDAIEEKSLSLVQKIAEACDAVGGVEKKGRNQQQGYDYVKAADVAKAIRHELFSRGVMIFQDEESVEWIEFTTMKGTVMRECRLKIAYKLSDGITEVVTRAYGVAMDSGDKAVYKAKTGALKYFLRGLGLIPDEKDDPEADESVDRHQIKPRETQPTQPIRQSVPAVRPAADIPQSDNGRNINPAMAKKFWDIVRISKARTPDQVKEYFGSIGIENTEEMLKKDFEACCTWARGDHDNAI